MPLTGSLPITLQAIQNEFGAGSLQAASTAALLDPLPTDMDDFLGLGTCTVNVTSHTQESTFNQGLNAASAIAELVAETDGVLYYRNGGDQDGTTNESTGSHAGEWRAGQCSSSSDFYTETTTVSETGSGDFFVFTRPAAGWQAISASQVWNAFCTVNSQTGAGTKYSNADAVYTVKWKKGSSGSVLATVTFTLVASCSAIGA